MVVVVSVSVPASVVVSSLELLSAVGAVKYKALAINAVFVPELSGIFTFRIDIE